MRILIKQTCAVKGEHCEAGKTLDVDAKTAQDLIAMGKAAEAKAVESKPKKRKK